MLFTLDKLPLQGEERAAEDHYPSGCYKHGSLVFPVLNHGSALPFFAPWRLCVKASASAFVFDFVFPALEAVSVALAGVRVFCYCNTLKVSLNGRRTNCRHWE
jgi:hypothetical protein